MSRAFAIMAATAVILIGFKAITETRWYGEWHHDIWVASVVKSWPTGLRLTTDLIQDPAVVTERLTFSFPSDLDHESVFIKVGSTYHIPLYADEPHYPYDSSRWYYIVLLDSLPATGTLYIRSDDSRLTEVPFEADSEKFILSVHSNSEGQYFIRTD